jgi:hypothetical protein
LLQSPFDLHVLGTPPAFILSQDQTLRIICFESVISDILFLLLYHRNSTGLPITLQLLRCCLPENGQKYTDAPHFCCDIGSHQRRHLLLLPVFLLDRAVLYSGLNYMHSRTSVKGAICQFWKLLGIFSTCFWHFGSACAPGWCHTFSEAFTCLPRSLANSLLCHLHKRTAIIHGFPHDARLGFGQFQDWIQINLILHVGISRVKRDPSPCGLRVTRSWRFSYFTKNNLIV